MQENDGGSRKTQPNEARKEKKSMNKNAIHEVIHIALKVTSPSYARDLTQENFIPRSIPSNKDNKSGQSQVGE